jgi:hypothetical protein
MPGEGNRRDPSATVVLDCSRLAELPRLLHKWSNHPPSGNQTSFRLPSIPPPSDAQAPSRSFVASYNK